MIKIGTSTKIEEISKNKKTIEKGNIQGGTTQNSYGTQRPEVVDAKVYKLKSAFVKNSVFITLSYVKESKIIYTALNSNISFFE